MGKSTSTRIVRVPGSSADAIRVYDALHRAFDIGFAMLKPGTRLADIYRAMQALYYEDRIVCEGASAVGAAALLSGRLPTPRGPVATIVTGRNCDMTVHADIMQGHDVRLGEFVLEGQPYGA